MTIPIEGLIAFSAAFFLLALAPGPGLAAILSRALGGGLSAGMTVTAGLVVGDAIFLGIAVIGLSAIASAMGPMFQIVKYAGAAYLIWLGIQALRASRVELQLDGSRAASPWRDFLLGLVVTMGNPKPILFYGALLPAFMDVQRITIIDFAVLMSVVVIISAIVYAAYILLLDRARRLVSGSTAGQRLQQVTGVMLIGSGLAVASR